VCPAVEIDLIDLVAPSSRNPKGPQNPSIVWTANTQSAQNRPRDKAEWLDVVCIIPLVLGARSDPHDTPGVDRLAASVEVGWVAVDAIRARKPALRPILYA
jgi:hypothetical protein